MFKRRYQAAIIIAIILPLSLIEFSPLGNEPMPTKATARFEIATWTARDKYGQGIEGFFLFENSTGSWQSVNGYITSSSVFNWTVGVGIRLYCYTWFNSTLTGATSGTAGKLYQRHNVTVISFGEVVFSKSNFTWYSTDTGIDPPMWFYEYYVTLNFLPAKGQYYVVVVSYEVFYGVG